MKKARPGSLLPLIPRNASLRALKNTSRHCKACDLWRNATQTVFGEGSPHAKIMMIGEQPGNQEGEFRIGWSKNDYRRSRARDYPLENAISPHKSRSFVTHVGMRFYHDFNALIQHLGP